MKTILKILLAALSVFTAIISFSYFKEKTRPDYVEIYSDEDELF